MPFGRYNGSSMLLCVAARVVLLALPIDPPGRGAVVSRSLLCIFGVAMQSLQLSNSASSTNAVLNASRYS